ncbi:MAG TPA: hypothetical protein VFE65_00970 [Pseudonocardia sp.]|nr:hypothetical protein [Pseudonocardia sp.]
MPLPDSDDDLPLRAVDDLAPVPTDMLSGAARDTELDALLGWDELEDFAAAAKLDVPDDFAAGAKLDVPDDFAAGAKLDVPDDLADGAKLDVPDDLADGAKLDELNDCAVGVELDDCAVGVELDGDEALSVEKAGDKPELDDEPEDLAALFAVIEPPRVLSAEPPPD